MFAFYNSSLGMIKIYNHGTDWQLVFKDGGERWFSIWERWFSIWKHSIMDSLERAIYSVDDSFVPDLLVICEV